MSLATEELKRQLLEEKIATQKLQNKILEEQLSQANYDTCTKYRQALKQHVATEYSKASNTTLPITERLAGGYVDACTVLGIVPATIDQFSFLGKYAAGAFAVHKIEAFIEALNEGWLPDFDNVNEYKYYPWWYLKAEKGKSAGSGFSLFVVFYAYPGTYVGARLVTKTEELAQFAAKVMELEYRIWIKKN